MLGHDVNGAKNPKSSSLSPESPSDRPETGVDEGCEMNHPNSIWRACDGAISSPLIVYSATQDEITPLKKPRDAPPRQDTPVSGGADMPCTLKL